MAYNSKYTGAEVDALLDKANSIPAKIEDLSEELGTKVFKSGSKTLTINIDSIVMEDGKRKVEIGYDSMPYIKATFNTTTISMSHNSLSYMKSGVPKIVDLDDLVTAETLKTVGGVSLIGAGDIEVGLSQTDKDKLDAIEKYTIGEGLKVENGVLKCSYTPARYYTGSSEPADTLGNNGDLYLQIQ